MKVGIIGLGLVGRAIAQRLVHAGHDVVGYDVSDFASASAEGLGVTICREAKAAMDVPVLILGLMDSNDRRKLLWGENPQAASLKAGTVILDVSTSRPEDIVEDAARLAEGDVRLIDVCIVGSSASVEEGRALALIGDEERSEDFVAIIRTFSRNQYYFGAPGRGNQMKLVVNLVLGLNRLALAEGLGMAKRDGLDLQLVLEVLRDGDAYSKIMTTKGPKMVTGEFDPPAARLAQHSKDVELILERASSIGAEVPLSSLHSKILGKLVDDGHGGLDNAAVFKAFD